MVGAAEYERWARRLEERARAGDDAERARAERELEFAQVYADHDRLLAEHGALDFGDLILHAFRLLHEKPHVRARVSERFRHLLVDEFQDTNFAQGALLRLLCQEHRNLTAVGDDDQAIYRFRGASRKNLLDFQREYDDCKVVRLERNYRSGQAILDAAVAVVAAGGERLEKRLRGSRGGQVTFWRCRSERAQAQAVAAECERLVTQEGVPPEEICVLVRSVKNEGQPIAAALEERAVPGRLMGAAAYFQRTEVRDLLAWLRLLADPADSGAVVRALSRPPIELRSVDIARLTQLARRRRLDMVAGMVAACDGPQLSPEGRDRVQAFLRLYRSASAAFAEMRPDVFVHRLVERIGLRRQQVFAAQADTVERLVNIAKLSELAGAYLRRQPDATPRDFVRYVAAVAEAGLREEEASPDVMSPAVQVMTMHSAKGLEFDHVFVLGLSANRMPGPRRTSGDAVPDELLRESLPDDDRQAHEDELRRLLHVAMTRARKGLVLALVGGGRARPPVALLRGCARGAARRRGGVRGRAVRSRRGAPLHLPPAARRAARQRLPGGRPPQRHAARHLPRRRPVGGALPRAAEGGGADRARARRSVAGAGPARGQRPAAPGGHARAARAVPALGARRLPDATASATSAGARR